MNFLEKINFLENYLGKIDYLNYADSFKTDILFRLGDFTEGNLQLRFLHGLKSKDEIRYWVDRLTSRIVIKSSEEIDNISEIIEDYFWQFEIQN